LFIFECFALFAWRVGDAFWCLLCLDSLLLATAQVLGYLLCEFAECYRVELGEEGAAFIELPVVGAVIGCWFWLGGVLYGQFGFVLLDYDAFGQFDLV